MPRNKKGKHRVLDSQQLMTQSSEDTVITNLGASHDPNVSPVDQLKVLQEMFIGRIEPDIVDDVFQECASNAEQTLESLLELCNTNHSLPSDDNPMLSSAQMSSNSLSTHVITEVPHISSERSSVENTSSNGLNQSTIVNHNSTVHNSFASTHQSISPLNAVMPFANLFSPKAMASAQSFKSSHQTKAKKRSLKDEIKEMIQLENEKVLIIMRGLPGCGKSTLARYLLNGCLTGVILSTDDYFYRKGVYQFQPSQLPEAHEWNHKRAKGYIKDGKSPVIIDNTNLESWEMKPYVSLGYNNGYKIYFLEPDTAWNRNPKELSKRNIHNIPKEKIQYMIDKFEKITVEEMIKSLPVNNHLIQSNSNEKVENKSFAKQFSASNNLINNKILKINLPISNEGNHSSSPDEYPHSESSPSSLSKLDDFPSSASNTEQTSASSPSRIDIDLLLALSQTNIDSEECSSINASEEGSSGVDQESGWERDEEFTWAQSDDQQSNVNDMKTSLQTIDESETNQTVELDPKSQKKKKSINKSDENCLSEANEDNLEITEHWDESENKNIRDNDMIETQASTSAQTNYSRKFGLFGVKKSNWEFPPFPIVSNHSNNDDSEVSITCYSRQTQTERKDWALLELSQRKTSKEGLETDIVQQSDNLIKSKYYPNKNLLKLKLHKGTFTSDLPDDLTRDEKLSLLKTSFPKAEGSHLSDILDACHEDFSWANKLLSELNDDHFQIGSLEQMPATSETLNTSPDIDESINNDTQSVPEEVPLKLVNDKNSDDLQFILTLDPILAAQLESHFGPISEKDIPITSDDLTITLSHGVARLLHHHWKKSFNQRYSAQSQQSSSKPFSINHNLIDYKSKQIFLEESTPRTEFEEIMNYQMAMDLSRQEYDEKIASKLNSLGPSANPLAKELLSTKLKREQLYQRYPGVDTGFLDEIFESKKFVLGKTIEVIDSSLGQSVDFSNETEALLAEENNICVSPSSSRTSSPVKAIHKTVDINLLLSDINTLLNKKKEFHDKAQLAYQRKMFAVASYYGDEASKFFTEIDKISKQIVDNILYNSTNSNELDLHGLHICEVNCILTEYLRRKVEELRKTPGKRKSYIDIITGYGATKGVQGRIKPTVIQYLKQKSFTFEMVNMGVIRVILTQS